VTPDRHRPTRGPPLPSTPKIEEPIGRGPELVERRQQVADRPDQRLEPDGRAGTEPQLLGARARLGDRALARHPRIVEIVGPPSWHLSLGGGELVLELEQRLGERPPGQPGGRDADGNDVPCSDLRLLAAAVKREDADDALAHGLRRHVALARDGGVGKFAHQLGPSKFSRADGVLGRAQTAALAVRQSSLREPWHAARHRDHPSLSIKHASQQSATSLTSTPD
jgi:hypothetical protein